jgi:hypothetical protein
MTPITLTEEQRSEVADLFDNAAAYQQTILHLSVSAKKNEEAAWKKIHNWYPETDTDNDKILFKLNKITGVITQEQKTNNQ